MTEQPKKEEWKGGELLFAGGTDWARVRVKRLPAPFSVSHIA